MSRICRTRGSHRVTGNRAPPVAGGIVDRDRCRGRRCTHAGDGGSSRGGHRRDTSSRLIYERARTTGRGHGRLNEVAGAVGETRHVDCRRLRLNRLHESQRSSVL